MTILSRPTRPHLMSTGDAGNLAFILVFAILAVALGVNYFTGGLIDG